MSNNTSSFSERDVSIRYAQTAPDQELYGGHPSTPPILVDASIESVETVLSDGTETGTATGTATGTSTSTRTAAIPPDADTSTPAPNMTVLGIYQRGSLPIEMMDLYLKDLQPNQIMVRERINTRPLLDKDDNSSDGDGDIDEEEEGRIRLRGGVRKKRSSKAWLRRLRNRRRRSEKSDVPDDEVETDQFEQAMLKPSEGLVMNKAKENYSPFYHEDLSDHDSSDSERVFEERAVLWQSVENYESLMGSPTMSKYFLPPHIVETDDYDPANVDDSAKIETIELILDSPRFGEQVLVHGLAASDIAIGDIFEVEGGHSPLKVEVSSPRLPCSYVDKRNGSPFGLNGVKRYTMTEGLAGWFTRVLVAGELREGMKCVRTAHPNPKWTLTELSKALYGEGPRKKMMKGYPDWSRSREELEELRDLAALGRKEWRDEVQWILDGEPDSSDEAQTKAKAEEEAGFNTESFMWIGGSVAACAITASLCGPMLSDIIETYTP